MHAQDDLNLGILHMFQGAGLGAQLDVCPTGDQEVAGLTPTGLATFCPGD